MNFDPFLACVPASFRCVSLRRLGCSLLLLLPFASQAQETKQTPAVTPGTVTTLESANARPIPDTPPGIQPITDYNLKLAWNEASRGMQLTYPNPSGETLSVYGIQASGNIFIVEYARTIPPRGTGVIAVTFLAKAGTTSDADVIRLLTSNGEKILRLTHDRAPTAAFEPPRLSWALGEAASAKSTILVLANGVQAAEARPMLGATAKLDDLGGGRYRVTVTPKSTDKPVSFPVFVTLKPEVPGSAPVLTCLVGSSN